MAVTATPELSAVRTSLSRPIVVAAAAFVLAGALRLTAAAEQLTLSKGLAVAFFVVAVVQIGFGLVLSSGWRRATTLPVAVTAMVVTMGFIGVWLVATTATVPLYPIMNGPYAVDVVDLGAAIMEVTSIVALCKSLPETYRRRVVWSLVGLIAVAWAVWSVVVVTSGLSD
jgi:hypothetical protein